MLGGGEKCRRGTCYGGSTKNSNGISCPEVPVPGTDWTALEGVLEATMVAS